MATLRLSTANHYTTTTTGGDSLVIVRDKVPGRKGIAGGRMLLETGEYKSTFLTEGISTYEVKKFIVNGVIYEQHLDAPQIVGGGILAGGTTLEATGDLTATPSTGSLSLTGYEPTVVTTGGVDHDITPDSGSLSLTGYAPTVAVTNNVAIEVPTGSLTVTGYAPVIIVSISVTPDVGAVALTGYTPTVTTTDHHIRAPPAGSLTLTGYAPTVDTTTGWSVVDVDLDESIYDGQTGVVVTLLGVVSATGKRVFIEQGANHVEQAVIAQDASSCTIDVTYDGVLSPGAATLYVWNPL